MKKNLLIVLFYPISILFAQKEIRKTNIDIDSYRTQLTTAPNENILGIGKTQQSTIIISLPFPDGTSGDFQMVEYSVLPSGTNTDIKTYYGQKIDDASVSCRVSITKGWLVATINTKNGIVVVEKSKQFLNANEYDVYIQTQGEFECKVEGSINSNGRLKDIGGIQNYTNGANLRTYRMAIIVTNEFYAARGNTDASINAELAAIINSLNGLYEKEIAMRFTLVTYPSSSNVFYRKTEAIATYEQNLNTINLEFINKYGVANYDIGHCLHTTGGGVAGLGVTCNNNIKGAGWSGSTSPSSFLVMAHEVGHQFNAPHTFLGNGNSSCDDNNRNLLTAFEPGSGNTIMSYAGLCAPTQNITGGQALYFHTNSLQNIITYIQPGGTGNTCGTAVANGNTPPVAVAGAALTIPKNTPFTLIGAGSDANGDGLTYTWEEYDLPVANDVGALGSATIGVGGYAAINSTTAPLFRSRQSGSPQRTFPSLSYILNNANNPADTEGEDLPNVSRTMNFRLTVRDNRAGGGGTHCSAVAVIVDATKGPLVVTLPNGGNIWTPGQSVFVNWNVNNTNLLSANVDIYLSVDGGSTFPYLVASNTPNDGSQSYIVPANIVYTAQARIKVVSKGSATSNFFDISDTNFTINNTNCQAINSIFCNDFTVSAPPGDLIFNLELPYTPVSSKFIGSSRVFNTAGAGTFPFISYTNDTYTVCQATGYSDKAVLVKFRVSRTGTYNLFSSGNNITAFSVFYSTTYDCNNFVGGNTYFANSLVYFNNSPRSIFLSACTTYYALLYNLNDLNTAITFDVKGVGDVYEESTNPVGYSYTYVALNTTTNTIASQSASPSFTSLPIGIFEVYGVMYKNSVVPSSFVGQTLQAVTNANCVLFSDNKKILDIRYPCYQSVLLSNPSDNIGSGNITKQTSATDGIIRARNYITGAGTRATYQSKQIELIPGFKADSGTIFKAEIGGCNY